VSTSPRKLGSDVFWRNGPAAARLAVEPLAMSGAPGALLEEIARQDDPAALESSAFHETFGRYTVLTCCPLEVLTLAQGALRTRHGHVLAGAGDDQIWESLDKAFGAVALRGPAQRQPRYAAGWIGYVGYEVGRHVERLPGKALRDTHLPDLRLAFYDALLVHDALQRRWWLTRLEFDSPPAGAGRAESALRAIIAKFQAGQFDQPVESAPSEVQRADPGAQLLAGAESNFTPGAYQQSIARCVEYIAAGDIFQANLSQRFAVRAAPPPLTIYQSLRRRNPAWYAAYLSFESPAGPCAVVSSSPELFLRTDGRAVTTRPIKGTRRRTGDPAADRTAAADLLASPKDNAELAMIIDLLRNDLGRVCRFGSIRVTEPRRLETHPTVFHLVGTVQGLLREGVGPAGLLRATFPGGSVTGAPKIRAMEIIDELEGLARGVYTGCIGYVGADGACEWNIAIRTIVCDGGTAFVQAGGGIVADSVPLAEYEETLDKARALLEAIAMARGNDRSTTEAQRAQTRGEKTSSSGNQPTR